MDWNIRWNLSSKTGLSRVEDRYLPMRFEMTSHNDDPLPDIRVVFEMTQGAYECREISLTAVDGGREINSTDLRSLRIDDLLEFGVETMGGFKVVEEKDGLMRAEAQASNIERAATVGTARRARAQGRRTITDDVLAEAAQVYRDHVGSAPTQAVADHFDKSLRTASLYMKRAREAGLLGDALNGKAGER